MENTKPNLNIFDNPRFGEWRPGNGKGGTYLDRLLEWFLG